MSAYSQGNYWTGFMGDASAAQAQQQPQSYQSQQTSVSTPVNVTATGGSIQNSANVASRFSQGNVSQGGGSGEVPWGMILLGVGVGLGVAWLVARNR